MSLLRTRWAALGAAVAVALGGGGIGLVSATTPADAVTFVPITPCRVIDTRPAEQFNVGPKTSPVGPEEEHSVKATGNSGKCTAVPNDATAVSLNVTALGATLPTFIAVYATGQTTPDASSLNPQPGAPPTPNAVSTELSADGEFTIFNKQGSVDVLADINGYYIDHHHDDRYYTKAQTDAAVDAATNPTSVYVSPGDLRGTDEWAASATGVRRGNGTNSCAYAPAEFARGRSIESFEVKYVAGNIPVEVRIFLDPFEEGFIQTPFQYVTTGQASLKGVGSNEFYYAVDTLPVIGSAEVPADGVTPMLQICTPASIILNSLRVNFAG